MDSQVGDGDTSSRCASRRTVLIVLLDDDTVFSDVLERDILVGDALDGTCSSRDSLDANTVVGVGDGGARNDDVLHVVVGTATNGADADAVPTGASAAGEVNVCTRVDSEAVVLVLDVCVGNSDSRGATNIEGIGVVAAVGDIASGVVDGDLVKCEISRTVDGEALYGCVLDVQSSDAGLLQGVGVEELSSQFCASK